MDLKPRILHYADQLFLRNGIKSVSMDDLAAELAMSKKTLYKTFANKDELVLAVMRGHIEKSERDCGAIAERAANAVEQCVLLARWADQQFSHIHPSIFHDLRKYHPAAWASFGEHKNAYILNQITQNLRRGMAEGLFRPDLDVDVLARLSLAEIELTFNPDLYPPADFAPARVNRVLDEHFLLGVVTLKGHRLFNKYQQITEEE